MSAQPRTLGIDLGTSGVRGVVLAGDVVAQTVACRLERSVRFEPTAVWQAVSETLRRLDLRAVEAVAVDGTSGTILPVDADGVPLSVASAYDQLADPPVVARIAEVASPASAAHGATSALGRAIGLQSHAGLAVILHEADWIAGRLCGRFDTADETNALKTGYDPVSGQWPGWLADAGMRMSLLPRVVPAGAALGHVTADMAETLGLPATCLVVAGTTDGCASFLASGAQEVGCGVTALGSTLTVKTLSDTPVFAPGFGIYSHRLMGRWLAGGASNTGGAVLARFFTPERITELCRQIDPSRDSGCDFYPLLAPGERFPINDPALPPRLGPRPQSDALFLHGLLEGIARVEALAYRCLAEQGAQPVTRVLTTGGGSGNAVWTAIRARALGVAVSRAGSSEAAVGSAMLARKAMTLPWTRQGAAAP